MSIRLFLSIFFLLSVAEAKNKTYKTSTTSCYGFPQVDSLKTSPSDACVGLVADKKSVPWKLPRKIVFVDESTAYVSAYAGWRVKEGQVWKMSLRANQSPSFELVHSGGDRTHGLALGPNDWMYFADATAIYRFKIHDEANKELVISGLPDTYTDRSGETTNSNHPLSEILFVRDGDLIVNVGAPSNDCHEEHKKSSACYQRDEQAHLRMYDYDSATDSFSQDYRVIAMGLRNSMGLVWNEELSEIYQAENASDAQGTPDELNIVNLSQDYLDSISALIFAESPQDFGWPFCYGKSKRYEGYGIYKTFCAKKALAPHILVPAHAAPLDMIYYKGDMFPSYKGHLMMSWHGHRPTGSRIAVYETDAYGRPVAKSGSAMSVPEFLVDGWQKDSRKRHPKGRPVGIGVDYNGAIWLVDDKNEALLVVARDSSNDSSGDFDEVDDNDEVMVDEVFSQAEISQWSSMFEQVIVDKQCASCHSDVVVDKSSELSLLNMWRAGWIDKDLGREDQVLWIKMTGANAERIMPPPPAKTILDDQGVGGSYESLRVWLDNLH